MKLLVALAFLLAAPCATVADTILLEDFGNPEHEWIEMNDPVMGGKSTGSFELTEGGAAIFRGNVAIVPFLEAPGFIKAETKAGEVWPDVSTCEGLQFYVVSNVAYDGFRVSFGHNRPPDAFPYTYGYKADMRIDEVKEPSTIQIPFTSFTDKWDAGTGDAITTCAEDPQFCPDLKTLQSLYSIAVWGEGVEGEVNLDLISMSAYACDGSSPTDPEAPEPAPEEHEEDLGVHVPAPAPLRDDDAILIEDFSDPINKWTALNDPVMGGKSEGTVVVEDGMAKFDGSVNIVPKLKAPGFITMVTGGFGQGRASFPDASSCDALEVVMRSREYYEGYYLSFGRARVPGGRFAMGYKTHFKIDQGDEFQSYTFPFDSFSAKWDDATGHIEVECSDEHPEYCPTKKALSNLQTISFWGEGVEGIVALDVKSIRAVGCSSVSPSATPVVGASAPTNTSPNSTSSFTMVACGLIGAIVALIAGKVIIRTPKVDKSDYEKVEGSPIV